MENDTHVKPEILAPAGDMDCFLAALAAGADAVYLGLKHFSARMEAENFSFSQLSRMAELAHAHDRKIYVAMNTLIKPDELTQAWRNLRRLAAQAPCDGLIFQDLAILDMARQSGFKGRLVFSTLANVSFPKALHEAAALGADRVVIPRELSLDEIKLLADTCPASLELECFIHGALCYCVSGRCYWSSYLGGKSGLRGRCVQPCRRQYSPDTGGSTVSPNGRQFFSCQDLELGALVKTLLNVPHLASWKIEGRKKGPHYVYHTVTAYRILRDNPDNPAMKKMALEILEQALGRSGVKANFLSQRPVSPMNPEKSTSSGLLVGKISFNADGKCQLRPRFPLLPRDFLRIGTENEPWHATMPVRASVPKRGVLTLRPERHKTPKAGVPVFLIDRREPQLEKILAEWRSKLAVIPEPVITGIGDAPKLPKIAKNFRIPRLPDMAVFHNAQKLPTHGPTKHDLQPAFWLSSHCPKLPDQLVRKAAFWLPPDIWPDNQKSIENILDSLRKVGARQFVCNAPWQRSLFPEKLPGDMTLLAGPFCNVANALAIEALAKMGFMAAFASQELDAEDLLGLPRQACLPLGLVLKGFFPVGISRFGLTELKAGESFRSPKGEIFWTRQYGQTTWIFPGWELNLTAKRKELEAAGYSFFAIFRENPPRNFAPHRREGLFNWNGKLL